MLLSLIGFDSTPGAVNSPNQILGLKALFSFRVPCLLHYSITDCSESTLLQKSFQLDISKKVRETKTKKLT